MDVLTSEIWATFEVLIELTPTLVLRTPRSHLSPSLCPSVQFSSVQSLSHVLLFVTPWTAACQASLSIINSQGVLKLTIIESVMPSNCLILCCPLLPPTSIFPSTRVFSNESALHIRWPSIRVSASASVLPMNIQD